MGGAAGSGGATLGGAGGMSGAATAGAAGSADTCVPGSHKGQGTMHCGMSDSGTADGNYTYNIYSSGQGSGCMTTYGVDATFSATWTNVGDWIARVGLSFDKSKTYDKIGVFSSDFAYTTTGITTGGFGNVGIYGWSVNPLHEYYIIEDWLGRRPSFKVVDTLTIDGEGTYEIQTNTQTNQPNITGTNATFDQFWSVRLTPRQCGHISISQHFDKWASLGLNLGNLEEARILVEAQNNSGAIDFTTGTVVVK
jgi:endo-1,4-beta-xylanase